MRNLALKTLFIVIYGVLINNDLTTAGFIHVMYRKNKMTRAFKICPEFI